MTARAVSHATSRTVKRSGARPTPRTVLRPPVVVTGLGRLGGALALGLMRAGWPVSALPQSEAGRARAEELGVPLADARALRAARVCLVAVQDAQVGARTAEVEGRLSPRCALVHCAGALPLTALGTDREVLRHPRGSLHPLCAVSDPRASLEGYTAALSATSPALLRTLTRMAEELGLKAIRVPEERRAAYHAGAVLSAGGVVSLLAAAVRALGEAGLSEEDAVAALLPLSRSALEGVAQRGLRRGLTGPVARGDAGVVRGHLAALPEEVARVYRPVTEWSLRLAALDEAQREAVGAAVAGGRAARAKGQRPRAPKRASRGRGR